MFGAQSAERHEAPAPYGRSDRPVISPATIQNIILNHVPSEEMEKIVPMLEWRELDTRETLYEPNTPVENVYFPVSGICSVIAVTEQDIRIETALVGREGFIGLPLLLHSESAPYQVIVQGEGRALRMTPDSFREAMTISTALQTILLRYSHAFTVQIAQSALANGRFTIAQRLARWLLMCDDRADTSELTITHEFMSLMLAVRRSGITDALHELEGMALIRSTRGKVVIINRLGLEKIAGSSYGMPEREYQRLIGTLGSAKQPPAE
jgi:CRP-like cAMP-binding protein